MTCKGRRQFRAVITDRFKLQQETHGLLYSNLIQDFSQGSFPDVSLDCNSRLSALSRSVVDPDKHWFWAAVSGSGRAKITHKNRRKWGNFTFWSSACSLLMAEVFSCSLDVLQGRLGIKKIFSSCNFFIQFLGIRKVDLDPHWPKVPNLDRRWNQCGSTNLALCPNFQHIL